MSSAPTLNDRLKIGVLDSGVGGLSILRLLIKTACRFNPPPCFIYLADTKRFPYGQRSKTQIKKFAAQMINWLAGKGCNVIVIACHTISAVCAIKDRQPAVPVFDLNNMGSQLAIANGRTVVVLSTPATANAATIGKSIAESRPDCKVLEIGCPELATIIEERKFDRMHDVLSRHAKQIIEVQADDVVLGCTHYPFIASELAEVLPDGINIIDPAVQFTDHFFKQLQSLPNRKISAPPTDAQIEFYVSGSASDFKTKLNTFTPELHGTVAPVRIEELERQRTSSSRLVLA